MTSMPRRTDAVTHTAIIFSVGPDFSFKIYFIGFMDNMFSVTSLLGG